MTDGSKKVLGIAALLWLIFRKRTGHANSRFQVVTPGFDNDWVDVPQGSGTIDTGAGGDSGFDDEWNRRNNENWFE